MNALRFVGDQIKKAGRNLDSLPLHFYAAIGAASPELAHQIASELVDDGLLTGVDVSTDDGPGMINVGMKRRGWEQYESERGGKEAAEWVRAAEAVAMLKPILAEHLARLRICERAHAGLVRSRAEHFHHGDRQFQNYEIPREFWWAKGREALEQDWAAGDFSTWLERRVPLRAFGVTFSRADIQRILPPVEIGQTAPTVEAKRTLTTIVSMDVAGYSARAEADEATATNEVAELQRVIEAIAPRHGGRIFNTAGDGFMLNFGSSLAAVEAALELADKCKPAVRIGVHLGDVAVQPNGDLLGHDVNVAARLMALADPGSVIVSAAVKHTIRAPLVQSFKSRGMQKLKNIGEAIEAFEFVRGQSGSASVEKSLPTSRRDVWATDALHYIAGEGAAWPSPYNIPDFAPEQQDVFARALQRFIQAVKDDQLTIWGRENPNDDNYTKIGPEHWRDYEMGRWWWMTQRQSFSTNLIQGRPMRDPDGRYHALKVSKSDVERLWPTSRT